MNIDVFAARDGYGSYLWDRVLWLVAPGAIVFLVGLAFLLKHLTPPPLNGGRESDLGHNQAAVHGEPAGTHGADHETPSP
jgi:hypothetical protein